MRLILKIVVAGTLIGAVSGCRLTNLGRNQGSNQVDASPEATPAQSATGQRRLRANQRNQQARNNRTTTNSSDANIDPEAPGNTQSVPALW
ncbi:MAG TPA: hypothetical protein DCP31_01960 [Cyanobacteria bacterium UBA8543]|nr:hypothetical protein [Cyanobacteria bacterium UBA8543]